MQGGSTRKMLICYVRHGQTFDNVNGVIAGHQPGKLTEVGVQQAHRTGEALKDAMFHHIYVSDLNRTKQTYEGIIHTASSLSSIQPTYTSLIREKSGGVLEGESLGIWGENAAKEKLPIRTYKCPEGESWEDVNTRSNKFLHQLIRTHLSPSPQESKQSEPSTETPQNLIKILVVTHGGFIMETHNVMNSIKDKTEAVFNNISKNCSFHQFEVGYSGEDYSNIDNGSITVECLKFNVTNY